VVTAARMLLPLYFVRNRKYSAPPSIHFSGAQSEKYAVILINTTGIALCVILEYSPKTDLDDNRSWSHSDGSCIACVKLRRVDTPGPLGDTSD